MEIPKLSIRAIDGLNYLQMSPEAFPKTFGMNELKKFYFPHYFNKTHSMKTTQVLFPVINTMVTTK